MLLNVFVLKLIGNECKQFTARSVMLVEVILCFCLW